MSSTESTLKFIEIYRKHNVLWDNNIKDYTNQVKRRDAINNISQKMNMTQLEVKNKIKSLRSYFSKEHAKVQKNNSGSAKDDNYESTWFGYKPLLFVRDSITPKETTDTLSTTYGEDLSFPDTYEGTSAGNRNLDTTGQQEENDCEFHRSSRRNLKRSREVQEQQAPKFLSVAADEWEKKDDLSIFGEMVASQLRNLSKRNQAIAKHEINNILFRMEMDEIDRIEHLNSSSPFPSRVPSPLSNPPLTPSPLANPPLVIKNEQT